MRLLKYFCLPVPAPRGDTNLNHKKAKMHVLSTVFRNSGSSGIVNKTISPFIKGTGTGITLWMSWEVGSRADLWGIQQWSMSQLTWPWHTRPAPVVGDSLNWHNLCRKSISLLVYFETQCLECAPERLQTGPECVGCWLSHSIFLLVTQNIEQMLSETLTWVRSHSNQWQNQDWAPGPCTPAGCAHSLTNMLHPVGVSLTYQVRFPEHTQFYPLSDKNISLRYCLGCC